MHGPVRDSSMSDELHLKRIIKNTLTETQRPATGHIKGTVASIPCTRSRKTPEHRPPRSHFSCTFANQGSLSLRERHSECGLPQEEPATHFIYYILCDCVQFADTLMMVSMSGIIGIWIFSRWHEIKCLTHRGTSVFATVVTSPLQCHFISGCFLLHFFEPFDQLTSMSKPRVD